MSLYVIEPRDPLIARDGRPAGVGGSFSTLRFPTPSTVAGAARTRMASVEGAFDCPERELDRLLEIEVHGPLLVELAAQEDAVVDWLLPAPRDAVLFARREEDGKALAEMHQLSPIELPVGCAVDQIECKAADPTAKPFLLPDFVRDPGSHKPHGRAPAYWHWSQLECWLGGAAPKVGEPLRDGFRVDPCTFGLGNLLIERRTHVALEPGGRVSVEGALFQTAGLRFLAKGPEKLAPRRLALTLRTSGGRVAERDLSLRPEVAPLGGDRRLARWRGLSGDWPSLPDSILQAIVSTRRARLLLLSPAAFRAGALPAWNGQEIPGAPGVKVRIRSACVGRAEVVSGWDLRASNGAGKPRGRAKKTRRLAPAGSVYFVELEADTEAHLIAWCKAVWFRPISDLWIEDNGQAEAQARRDGFGLAALGTWPEPMRKEPS